jgi:hemerythrin
MSNDLYIVWNKENDLGIPIIDEQHRGLVSAINSYHYFIKEGKGVEMVKPIIMTLVQYIDVHFRTEEPLMKDSGYPGYEDHIRLHRKLTLKTENIARESIDTGNAYIALDFLKDWWLNHINSIDRQYVPYVRKMLGIT